MIAFAHDMAAWWDRFIRVIQLVRAATGRESDISEQGHELLVALLRPMRRDQAAK